MVLKYLKPLWKHVFLTRINVSPLVFVQTKSQSRCYINNNYKNVHKKSFFEFENRTDKNHRTQKDEKRVF